ncbi:MAG: ATP-binding cassette domain-containing protein [Propionibacteriaceae bacterium]|jgi:peptide/nickel transport system ATP-binding protein|nr:ATP-binding cassette domain-containing protein [Propionibacteriaceae bacterium]
MSVFGLNDVSVRFGGRRRSVEALRGVDLVIEEHERWGIVGESGSGKTTLLKLLAGLEAPTSGSLTFFDAALDLRRRETMAKLRSSVQMVFQDPRGSLDPRMTIADIVAEPLRSPLLRGRGDVPRDRAARVDEVLEAVGLDRSAKSLYPHEFSGGQRQRIALARALAPRPKILLADEPVSALDVSVRAHVLNLVNDLVDSMGLTLVMVTHDLAVVRHTCDHVGVLRHGQLVEVGATGEVMDHPRQAYTKELINAVARLDV